MTVYADALFLMNFIMDYIIISVAGILAALHIPRPKKLLGAAVGAVFAILRIIFFQQRLAALIITLAVPPLVMLTVLCPCGKPVYFRGLFCFFAAAFVCSGAVSASFTLFGVRDFSASPVLVYFVGTLVMIIIKNTHTMLKISRGKSCYRLTVKYRGRAVTANAVLDTGNSLTDPIGKKPVIVAGEDILSRLFSSECNLYNITEWLEAEDLRLIPYSTIDKDGVMIGFSPDCVLINGRKIPDVIIAISEKPPKGGILLGSAVI